MMLDIVWAARDHGESDEKQNLTETTSMAGGEICKRHGCIVHSKQKSKEATESQYIGKIFDVDLSR